MWIPTYLLDYVGRVGANGLSLYAFLAWHCTRESPVRWPSINQLARKMGVSRSTVERTMRALKEVGLIETTPCFDAHGQHSNYFDLTDPPEYREQSGSHGAPAAGAVTVDGAPLSPMTGVDVNEDGAPLSPMTAPSLKEDPEELCVEEVATHTTGAALTIGEAIDIVARLAAQWKAHNGPGSATWFEEQVTDFQWAAKLSLSRNWTEQQLAASITDPARPVGEWPREWLKRLGPRPPQPKKTPASPLTERQRRLQEEERLAAERQTQEYKAAVEELQRKIGKPANGNAGEG
jgi:transposase-like protein